MNKYEIIKTPQRDFTALIIQYTSDSLFSFISELESELKKQNICGNILIDQILHSGNNNERFISAVLNGELVKDSFKFEILGKKSFYREISCKHLKDRKMVDGTILTSTQSEMIKKGIVI